MNRQDHDKQKLDEATSNRLAAFGRRDVDVSSLQQRVQTALDEQAEQTPHAATPYKLRGTARPTWFRPAMAMAAMLAIAAAVFFGFGLNNPPSASAAVLELSALHDDIAAGRIALTPASSVQEANRWIVDQMASAPTLPEKLANARIQSCCLANVQGELAAVALLRVDETPVTLVVARAPDFGMRSGDTIVIDGQTFYGHHTEHARMVMANHGDRWMCVMGDRSYQELAEIAAGIDF